MGAMLLAQHSGCAMPRVHAKGIAAMGRSYGKTAPCLAGERIPPS